MIRKAFLMFVNPDCHVEYKKRHDDLWQAMSELLSSHGVSNYSIHLFAEQNMLFGYAEVESEEKWAAIADTEICKEWWAYMKDVMPSNADNSPVSRDLTEVFYLK
ncbi:L-rhamnose mutarotase [Vibrio viridaestus]|uniref:L-rhamnose mutarotase n=1 Tax=Vibrio viridaestus TaxID=2487322 RepID=A0A3N9TDW5_9VIBR|nr:L-rhamnose mutarotase [Vibrio viridaestus]RQW61893.1 L-rhamnose mutarotase [Vibrio viridaestus]